MCIGVSVGVCTCNAPFQGPDCSIDGSKPPKMAYSRAHFLGLHPNIVLSGSGFFKSDALECELTGVEVSSHVCIPLLCQCTGKLKFQK